MRNMIKDKHDVRTLFITTTIKSNLWPQVTATHLVSDGLGKLHPLDKPDFP